MITKTRLLQILVGSFLLLYASVSIAEEITITPKMGERFTLHSSQSARIDGIQDEVVFKCKGFKNSSNNRDVISGDIYGQLSINGAIIDDPSKRHYDVEVVGTDFRTFATFTVEKSETRCEKIAEVTSHGGHSWLDNERNDCWSHLATRFSDINICKRIVNITDKDRCIETVLEKLQKPEKCDQVTSQRYYCRYIEAINSLNVELCTYIYKADDHYRNCFIDIARKTQKGDQICEQINKEKPQDIESCKDIINGKIKPINNYNLYY